MVFQDRLKTYIFIWPQSWQSFCKKLFYVFLGVSWASLCNFVTCFKSYLTFLLKYIVCDLSSDGGLWGGTDFRGGFAVGHEACLNVGVVRFLVLGFFMGGGGLILGVCSCCIIRWMVDSWLHSLLCCRRWCCTGTWRWLPRYILERWFLSMFGVLRESFIDEYWEWVYKDSSREYEIDLYGQKWYFVLSQVLYDSTFMVWA